MADIVGVDDGRCSAELTVKAGDQSSIRSKLCYVELGELCIDTSAIRQEHDMEMYHQDRHVACIGNAAKGMWLRWLLMREM